MGVGGCGEARSTLYSQYVSVAVNIIPKVSFYSYFSELFLLLSACFSFPKLFVIVKLKEYFLRHRLNFRTVDINKIFYHWPCPDLRMFTIFSRHVEL